MFYEPSWDPAESPLPDADLAYWMHHVHSPAPPSPLGPELARTKKSENQHAPSGSKASSPMPPLYTPDALRNFWPTELRPLSPGRVGREAEEDEMDGQALQTRLPWLYMDQRADPHHWSKVHFSRTYYRNLLPTPLSVNGLDSDWDTEDSDDETLLGYGHNKGSNGASEKRQVSALKRRGKGSAKTKKKNVVSIITQAEINDLVFV